MNLTVGTYTKKTINIESPSMDDISIVDIAHHLSRINRWAGALERSISVAQHSIEVSKRVYNLRPELALAALLHDASEAYLCDLPSGVKVLCHDYQRLEEMFTSTVERKYGIDTLSEDERTLIKHEDIAVRPDERYLTVMSPDTAAKKFLEAFIRLVGVE